MNEAFTNLAILGGYVALGYLVYWGYEWLWWKCEWLRWIYVNWYVARVSRRINPHTSRRDRVQQQPDLELVDVKPATAR